MRPSFITITLFVLTTSLTAFAQAPAPALSRGLQQLEITQDECHRRARRALEQEGFKLWQDPGPDYHFAYKGSYSAVIMCNAAPEGKIWVNVVVALGGSGDGPQAGIERINLQHRMDPQESQTVTTPTTWTTQPNEITQELDKRITLTCPGNGTISSRIWGTDLYTNDSSVCTAAVHAGLITVDRGGVITFETRAGLSSYKGSVRNGVTSQDYGSWSSTFVFLR